LTTVTEPVEAARPDAAAQQVLRPRNRLGSFVWNRAMALAGLPWQRRLARAALQVPRIRHWEAEYERLSDPDLKVTGLRLRGRARGGEALDRVLPEAFGLVCVAARRFIETMSKAKAARTTLLPFGSDVETPANFTDNKVLLIQNLNQVRPGGATARQPPVDGDVVARHPRRRPHPGAVRRSPP